MTHLAVLLLAVGVADLVRDARRASPRTTIAAAGITIVAAALLADLWSVADVLMLLWSWLIATAWLLLSARAARRHREEVQALAALGGGVLGLLLVAGWGSSAGGLLGRWLRWVDIPVLHQLPPERFLLIFALMVIQLATGNELVRLVLSAVGAIRPKGEPQPSDHLRGGRLLGPMERAFILGLGLAGQVTAAGLVIAAKGLIRFPELNARHVLDPDQAEQDPPPRALDIDQVTEYFLVGSFVSWLVALTSLGLAGLG